MIDKTRAFSDQSNQIVELVVLVRPLYLCLLSNLEHDFAIVSVEDGIELAEICREEHERPVRQLPARPCTRLRTWTDWGHVHEVNHFGMPTSPSRSARRSKPRLIKSG